MISKLSRYVAPLRKEEHLVCAFLYVVMGTVLGMTVYRLLRALGHMP